MTKVYYIYQTTNNVNGKKYVGLHRGAKFAPWYKGSGNLIKKAIEKYGSINFTVEVLEWCENEEHMREREKYWIQTLDALNSDEYYNLHEGGRGGPTFTGKTHTEETRKIFRENRYKYQEKILQASREKCAKEYIITFPDGHEETIKNLAQFCRDNKLDQGTMYSIMRGNQDFHKGYSVRRIGKKY